MFRDPHFQCAVLLALPVWAALASGIGGRLYRPESAAAWLGFVPWPPMLEEVLFRGLLQGWLLRMAVPGRIAGISAANGISAAAFVAIRVPMHPLAWPLAVAGPSFLFGHLRERLRSV